MMKKRKGFTLIEVIVTITILMMVAIAGFSVLQYCQYLNVDSELRLMAVNFARETMEGHYWDNALIDTAGWQADILLPTGAQFGSRLSDDYSGQREYNITTDPTNSYKIIKTKVQWNH